MYQGDNGTASRTPTVQQVEELRVAAQGHMDAGNLTTVTYLENAADLIEALTRRLASSYDNEIAVTEENERLRWALRKFGGHLQGCTKRTEQLSEYACTCGYTKAVNGGR